MTIPESNLTDVRPAPEFETPAAEVEADTILPEAVEELLVTGVDLLGERQYWALRADGAKDQLGLAVLAPKREMDVLERVLDASERRHNDVLDRGSLIAVYTQLMRATRARQVEAREARRRDPQPESPPTESAGVLQARLNICRTEINRIDGELIAVWSRHQELLLEEGTMPLRERLLCRVIELCRDRVARDAAETPGSLPLDIPEVVILYSYLLGGMYARRAAHAATRTLRQRQELGWLAAEAATTSEAS